MTISFVFNLSHPTFPPARVAKVLQLTADRRGVDAPTASPPGGKLPVDTG